MDGKEYAGLCLHYRVVMPNPNDEAQFLKDFKEMQSNY